MARQELDVGEELRKIPLFAELGDDYIAELAKVASVRQLESGATLNEQGTPASTLDVLVRGSVKFVRETRHASGVSTVVLDVARAPHTIAEPALFDAGRTMASTVALRPAQVISFERRIVTRLMANSPPFSRALLYALAQTARRHVRRVDEVASGSVDERITHLFEALASESGTPFESGKFIAIPLRRREIACMVNATTETVSRILARLEREGRARSTRDGIWWKGDERLAAGAKGKSDKAEKTEKTEEQKVRRSVG